MTLWETFDPFLYPDWLDGLHHLLPSPFDEMASWILLEHVERASEILIGLIVVLLTCVVIQLRAFVRPPPVPLKRLPKRPAVSVQFQPDDPTTLHVLQQQQQQQQQKTAVPRTTANDDQSTASSHNFLHRLDKLLSKSNHRAGDSLRPDVPFSTVGTVPVETVSNDEWDLDDDEDATTNEAASTETPFLRLQDLPDSFAPLLSSSHTNIVTNSLTAELVHAVQTQAHVRLSRGKHEIPLDKDVSRPQLQLDVSHDNGCKVSAVCVVGSDGLSDSQDMDVSLKTETRSKPMVKHAGLSLDPPLPLVNVAPTLIHFPTLFEDRHMLPALRSMQLVRFFMDFIVSISSFLEKCLWIIESQCQIHLGKVRVVPIYKGQQSTSQPDWRLQLSFSGHVLLFGWIPIPFVSVTLPTFIIPQPHALLDQLISPQPLASATLKKENIAQERIAVAILNTVESWTVDLKLVATPPAVGVDVTLPGGVSFAVEMGLWRDHYAGRNRASHNPARTSTMHRDSSFGTLHNNSEFYDEAASINSMSSWTTRDNVSRRTPILSKSSQFDANQLVPWLFELSAKGTISHEKMSFHVLKLALSHEGSSSNAHSGILPAERSQLGTRGSFAVWKYRPDRVSRPKDVSSHGLPSPPMFRSRSSSRTRAQPSAHPELETEDSPSVAAILLFPDETSSFHNEQRMLQYDYVFDVFEDSKVDAITVSIGASHPMLNGGHHGHNHFGFDLRIRIDCGSRRFRVGPN